MKPEDLAIVQDGIHLQNVLPHIREATDKMERALENRVFMAIETGTMTPEFAVSAWMEKAAIRKLLSRFDSKVRLGQTIGENVKPYLDKL